jgi:hypothetical protein
MPTPFELEKTWITGEKRGTTVFNASGNISIGYGRNKITVSGVGGAGNPAVPSSIATFNAQYAQYYNSPSPGGLTGYTGNSANYTNNIANYNAQTGTGSYNAPTPGNPGNSPTPGNQTYNSSNPNYSYNVANYNSGAAQYNPSSGGNATGNYNTGSIATYNPGTRHVVGNSAVYEEDIYIIGPPVFVGAGSYFADYYTDITSPCPSPYNYYDPAFPATGNLVYEGQISFTCTDEPGGNPNYTGNTQNYNPTTPGNLSGYTGNNANYVNNIANYNAQTGTGSYNSPTPGNPGNSPTPGNQTYNSSNPNYSYNVANYNSGAAQYNVPTPGNIATYNNNTADTYNSYVPAAAGTPTNVLGVTFPGGAPGSVAPYTSGISNYWDYPDNKTYPVTIPPGGQITVKIE